MLLSFSRHGLRILPYHTKLYRRGTVKRIAACQRTEIFRARAPVVLRLRKSHEIE